MNELRVYQKPLLVEDGPGVVVLHWARQIGKSYTLATWAVTRLMDHPGRLVTVLSNSKENGAEFVRKCAEICEGLNQVYECETEGNVRREGASNSTRGACAPQGRIAENFRMEVRIRVDGHVGRIKVLAANPRTARGFSGDLILDEFAFHEDSAAIWEAVEPILASNPDFRCRIASTGNGRHNMFYRMVNGVGSAVPTDRGAISNQGLPNDEGGLLSGAVGHRALPNDHGEFYTSAAGFVVSRVTRTGAYGMGVKIYDLKQERKEITPEQARAQAMDKRAYDQNYECVFGDENMTLLTYELIAAAQSDVVSIDSQDWSTASVERMRRATGALEVGNDIGNHDLSFVTVVEREGQLRRVIAMLKLEDMRLPDQQKRLFTICNMPKFHAYCGDMTGLGLGLVEFLQDQFGSYKIRGVNFSSTEPVTGRMKIEGRKQETARVTEIMAVNLLSCFEERTIKDLPNDAALVEDLRKPEKITSPGGRVSIAAVRDGAGHADAFWSLALAVRAGEREYQPFAYQRIKRKRKHPFWKCKIIF